MSTVPVPTGVLPSRESTLMRPTPTARRPSRALLRSGTEADARAMHALVAEHVTEGRLLARSQDEIAAHAHRFVVAVRKNRLVGCADLAPLSRAVAEVRSLVVSPEARSIGLGRRLIDELVRRAAGAGFEKLCAFTHAPAYFLEMGFSIVPHAWLPEKIEADCSECAQFRHCGQYAVVLPLVRPRQTCVPLALLHG